MSWHVPHRRRCRKRNASTVLKTNSLLLNKSAFLKFQNHVKNRRVETLYIIGNGFDLHHGLKSQYIHFYKYLQENNVSLLQQMSNYYDTRGKSQLWQNFEKELSKFNSSSLEENFVEFLPDYTDDNFRDRDRYALEFYIEDKLGKLHSEMQSVFENWINSIEIPSNISNKKILLKKNAIFLNFNYTNILETVYGIHRNHILYIHNRINEGKKLIYGHSWEPRAWSKSRKPVMPDGLCYEEQCAWEERQADNYDYSIDQGHAAIDDFYSKTYKNCEKLIEENSAFFLSLKRVNKIYILGHSVSDIDLDYYKKIIECTNKKKVHWIISDYKGDSANKRKNLISLGVEANKIECVPIAELDQ